MRVKPCRNARCARAYSGPCGMMFRFAIFNPSITRESAEGSLKQKGIGL